MNIKWAGLEIFLLLKYLHAVGLFMEYEINNKICEFCFQSSHKVGTIGHLKMTPKGILFQIQH